MKTTFKFFLLVLFFGFCSCSNNLSRKNAEKMIKEKYNLPCIQTKQFWGILNSIEVSDENEARILYQPLIDANLIELKVSKNKHGYSFARISFTKKGKELVHDEDGCFGSFTTSFEPFVKVCEIDIDNITGIEELEQFKTATVKFTLKHINITPFGKFLNIENEKIERTARFTLYDDEWKIEKN